MQEKHVYEIHKSHIFVRGFWHRGWKLKYNDMLCSIHTSIVKCGVYIYKNYLGSKNMRILHIFIVV